MDAFLIIIICIMAFVLTVINVYVLVRSFELALVRVSDNVMSPPPTDSLPGLAGTALSVAFE